MRAAAGAAASGDLLGLAAPGRLGGWEGAGGVKVCPHCGWRFRGAAELAAHVARVHAPGAGSSAANCIIL